MTRHVSPAASVQTPRGTHHRPHLFALAFGLVDAHYNGVDYFDTVGGDELRRLYRQRQARRHGSAAAKPHADDDPDVRTRDLGHG